MQHKLLRFGLVFLFLAGLIVLFIYFNITRPRVLILHSYDTSYSWTRDVDVGLRRILDQHTNYAIRWHYMDTKRHPQPSFKRVAGIAARRAIEQWQPHVVIAVDDDAQQFAARHFVNHPSIDLVFAGVNGEIEPYGYAGAHNVTGILERKQLLAVKEIAQVIGASLNLGSPLRIIHIGDSSGSVNEDAKFMDEFDWAPVIFAGSKLVGTFPEWQQAVTQAPDVADMILITNYRKLTRSSEDQVLVPSRDVMKWTSSNARLALIGTNLFNVEDGANLAVGVSPYEQGEVAAMKAVSIVEGDQEPRDIPLGSTQQYIVSMRKEGLERSGIALPSVYEAFARATNNYFDTPAGDEVIMLAQRTPGITTSATASEPKAQNGTLPAGGASGEAHEPPSDVPDPPQATTPQAPPPAASIVTVPPGTEDQSGQDAPAAIATRQVRLDIVAREASWAEVWDASGQTLLRRMLKAGSSLSLSGVPPLRVKLGRPEAVRLEYDGRPADLRHREGMTFTLE